MKRVSPAHLWSKCSPGGPSGAPEAARWSPPPGAPRPAPPSSAPRRLLPLTGLITLCALGAPGEVDASRCRGEGPQPAELGAFLDEAAVDILSFEAAPTRDRAQGILDALPCMQTPIDQRTLGRLWFTLGVSRLYAADELGEDPRNAEPFAREAFELAHQVAPELVWDQTLYGDYGQRLWEEATTAWDAAVGAAKAGDPAKGYWVEVKAEGWPAGGVFVDGRLAEALGSPPTLHRGQHLLQYKTPEGLKGAWVVISPGQLVVTLPLPGTLPTLGPGPEAGIDALALPNASPPAPTPAPAATGPAAAPRATPAPSPSGLPLPTEAGAPVAEAPKASPGTPSAGGAPKAAAPPADPSLVAPLAPPTSTARRRGTAVAIFAPTWTLPQLFSGPEVQLRVSPTRRLSLSLGAGAALGALRACPGCVPKDPDQRSVIFPVRGEVALRLGQGPVELDVGVAWQGYFGGGFGDTSAAPTASAQGYEGALTLLVGQGPWRGALRIGGGQLLAPASLVVPQGSIGLGLVRAIGG